MFVYHFKSQNVYTLPYVVHDIIVIMIDAVKTFGRKFATLFACHLIVRGSKGTPNANTRNLTEI